MTFTILRPGRNAWRIERAARAAVLIDGAAFFGAVRRAFLKAQRRIFIVGWDIDSRTRLIGNRIDPDDGYSPFLAEFLSELVETKPELEVYILLWDFSLIYVQERELFPRLSLQWQTPTRVTLCMDDAVPFGSSQHQKLIIVDDTLAFSGGLDLTGRRWDRSDHKPVAVDRIDPSNRAYGPFHDVQMMVDGSAAKALALLARQRWCNAHGTEPPIEPSGNPWPEKVLPDFHDIDIGISRTQPAFGEQQEVREVEALFLDSIDRAERSIYIENQYMSSMLIADRLARRLRERPRLEILAVVPRRYKSRIVSITLGEERNRFLRILHEAGGDRVRVVYPDVRDGEAAASTMVHSKITVVDDRLLRVGSANLNNRSMATDTECDLTIEAGSDSERAAILRIRNRLLGDHCGVSAETMSAALEKDGSLIAVADHVSAQGHKLRPIEETKTEPSRATEVLKSVVDPKKPFIAERLSRLKKLLPLRVPTILLLLLALAMLILSASWHWAPVAEFITVEHVKGVLAAAGGSTWAPVWVLLTYVLAGVVAFPVLVLIVATAVTFGPWFGFVYAMIGVLASSLVMYGAGAWLGSALLQPLFGKRWQRARRAIDDRGILAVAVIRLVPVAPFTLINLLAGACSIKLLDYFVGTIIGMLPGLIVISALGHQITMVFTDFSATNAALLLLCIALWVSLAWSAQALGRRLRRTRS